jgi:hypothetical protein
MENTALLLIIVTLLLLVIIVGLLCLLIFKIFKQGGIIAKDSSQEPAEQLSRSDATKEKYHPAILERMVELEKIRPKRSDLFCPNHSDEPGEVTCAICDKLFCKACIRPFKSMHFCKEHLPLIMRYDWDEVFKIKTSTSDPERGVKLYEAKKQVFEQQNIPTYIETHYKINVDQDYIETYLVLYSIRENVEDVKKLLQVLVS